MGEIAAALAAQREAVELLQGHVDTHGGDVDGACARCVDLAAGCGVDLARPVCTHPEEEIVRIGWGLRMTVGYKCLTCGRVES